MPAEPMSLLLRPRHFFTKNPALDVPPSFACTPSSKKGVVAGVRDGVDSVSRMAFGQGERK